MAKKAKLIILAGVLLCAGFITLIILLINGNNRSQSEADRARMEVDSLKIAVQQNDLDRQFTELTADFDQYEDQAVLLKNDTLVQQYNASRARIQELMQELKKERSSHNRDMAASQRKIAQLEAEITTLKGIVKHYLEEINRLGVENEGLKRDLATSQQQNQTLNEQVQQTSATNAQLNQTVQLARKLNITGLSLTAYNKKDKPERKVTKATKLGVSFIVSPNNTASPGKKTFYIRILSPEGTLLGGGVSCSYSGQSVACTTSRTLEYDNGELPVSAYWGASGVTLTPGDYTVEVFADGYRLGSRHITLSK